MDSTQELNELATALAKAQGKIRVALKDSNNTFHKSKYADLASVWEACRNALSENGLSVIQLPTDAQEGRIAVETILLHSSGQYVSGVVSTKLVKDDPQGVGSAVTYLRRYGLCAMVGVVADEDDDGNAASGKTKAPPVKVPDQITLAEIAQASRDWLEKHREAINAAPVFISAAKARLKELSTSVTG